MIRTILFVTIVSFLSSLIATPMIINYLRSIGISAKDIHKRDRRIVTRSAGWIPLIGTLTALLGLVFIHTFIYQQNTLQIVLFGAITTFLIITFAGFLDDIPTRRDKAAYKQDEGKYRLKQWQKPLLVLPAVIPLMVISAGNSIMSIPFIGDVNFGLLYPLLLVPIGIFGAANMVNMLEGLNGLSSGMGLVWSGMLGIYAWVHGSYIGSIISFAVFGSLLVLFFYHTSDASIHAGDSLTYFLGAALACIAILGNIEKAVLICSIPFFIEFMLKLRGRFKKETLGYVDNKNKLHSKYKKIYSLPHIWMRTGRFREDQIVGQLMLVELVFALLIWFV